MSVRVALLRGAFVCVALLLPSGTRGAEVASAKTCLKPEAAATDKIPWEAAELFTVLQLRGAAPGTTAKVVWVSVDAIDPPNFVIQTDEQKVPSPGGAWGFTFSAPKEEWPAGNYRVDVYLDGTKARSLPFSVLKASAAGRTAGTPVARYQPGSPTPGAAPPTAAAPPAASGTAPRATAPPPPAPRPSGGAPPVAAPPPSQPVPKEPESPLMDPSNYDLSGPKTIPYIPTPAPQGPQGGYAPPPVVPAVWGAFCTQASATPEGLTLIGWSEFDGTGQFSFGSTYFSGYGEVAGTGPTGGGRYRLQSQLLFLEFVDGSQGVGAVLAQDGAGRVTAFQFGQLVYAMNYCPGAGG